MKVSVCVPTSRPDTVALTIQSILKQSWPDWELIAVGQGDPAHQQTQATEEAVTGATSDERVRYVHTPERGATRARNKAMAAATGDVFAFIDDDCEAHESWLAVLMACFEQDPGLGLVGGAVIAPPKTGRGIGRCPSVSPAETVYDPPAMSYTPPPGWEWISCNVAITRAAAEAIGPWDEYLGPGTEFPAADDTDYLLRAEALDIRMATTPRAIVYHTYGYRYNRQLWKHSRNYAYANGGLAAKLTLMGDRRGAEWFAGARHDRLARWVRPFRPHRIVAGAIGWRIFSRAYAHCLQQYRADGQLLQPASAAPQPA